MPEKPDLLVSADGLTARSTGNLDADEIRGYLDKGWRRVPFDQYVAEQAPSIAEEASEKAVARVAETN